MSNYFAHPYVSNSALSQLRKDLSVADQIEYANAYRLGTLLDVMVTTPLELDLIKRTAQGYTFSQDEIDNTRKMRASFLKDTLAPHLMRHSEFQKEMYVEDVQFEYDGVPFSLNCKCKFDGYCPALGYGWDLKSTTAKNLLGFQMACERFGYYRQAYWYMKLSGSAQMVLIGISKINHAVFKVFIREGDPKWLAGKNQACELAFKYYTLKPQVV